MQDWLLLLVASIYLLAALTPVLYRLVGRRTGTALAVVPAAWCAVAAAWLPVGAEVTARSTFSWVPALRLEPTLVYDGLGALFTFLILGIGALVLIYADGYREGEPRQDRFLAYLLLFMGSMLGVVLAGDLLTLFVFWELTSVTSYLLIGFERERAEARQAALRALLVTGVGGLTLLAAAVLLGQIGGTTDIAALGGQRDAIVTHPWYTAIAILVVLAAFTKSAQVPFHAWLPGAMEAPTPVSAYLHSATMVKAGVYLLIRITPVLGGTDLWGWLLTIAGAATLLLTGVLAIAAREVKRALAYSTTATLGMLTLLIGVGTADALHAAAVLILAHALYKAALFKVGGNLLHGLGHGNLDAMGRLGRVMPLTAGAGVLAAIGMAGLPPGFGFIAKELTLAGVTAVGLLATVGIGGALLATVAVTAGVRPFFGGSAPDGHPHEGGWALWFPPVVLAVAGVVAGLLPALVGPLVTPATAAVAEVPVAPLHLWHGVNVQLIVGLSSAAAGVLLALARPRWQPALARRVAGLPDAEAAYDQGLAGLYRAAAALTVRLQHGLLPRYILVTMLTAAAIVALPLIAAGQWPPWTVGDTYLYEALLALILMAGAVVTARARSRLLAITALGTVGYAVALLFAAFGAPDLAMTQFAVETLSVVLLLLVLRGLPKFASLSPPFERRRNVVVACLVGLLTTVLVLEASVVQWGPAVSRFFVERSLPDAKGANVVNVILVDFRALDTLGEITVLATAGLGVWALMRLRPSREDTSWIR